MNVASGHNVIPSTPAGDAPARAFSLTLSLNSEATSAVSTPAAALARLRSRLWLRFLVVGIVSSLGYVVTMAVCVGSLGWRPTGGAVAAFAAGTLVSYLGNTCWTFGAAPTPRNLVRFSIVVAVGLLLNVAIAWSLEQLGLHHLIISLAVLTVVPIFNFVGHRFWTYAA